MRANLIKRYISFLMSVVMLIGVMPLSIMASPQKNVNITNIVSEDNKVAPAYSFKIDWTNPANWELGTGENPPTKAKIKRTNVSLNDSSIHKAEEADVDKKTVTVNEDKLEYGSIYEYEILPYHTHKKDDGTTQNIYPPYTPEGSALFMTDIRVNAKGYVYDSKKGALEVTFDNPTYKGKDVFTGYNIYYQDGSNPTQFNNNVQVDIKSPELIRSKDPNTGVDRITYTIVSEKITPSTIYSVKVEPIYNGQEIRTSTIPRVMIDNKSRIIGFNKKNKYIVNNAYVSIPLYIYQDGKDHLLLEWIGVENLISKPGVKINKIEILSGPTKDQINNVLGTIYGDSAKNINYLRISKPSTLTYYKIKVCLVNDKNTDNTCDTVVESDVNWYDPSIVNVTPNKPVIYPEYILENNSPIIDLYWDTFTRPAYNEEEKPLEDETGFFVDTNVVYDVWVTDNLKNLDKVSLPKIMDRVSAKELEITTIPNVKNKVFHNKITEYVTTSIDGSFIKKPIDENKVYYIKIIARKPISEESDLSSMPAISQIYVPPMGDISTPKSLSKPPLRVKKDENGNDVITKNEITIQWNTKWLEVYDVDTETWYSSAAINKDGKLVYGKDIKDTDKIIEFYDKETIEDAKKAFSDAGASVDSLLFRTMDLHSKNIEYEMIVLPFDEIEQSGGYEKYIENLLQSNSDLWKKIGPTFTEEKYAEYLISNLKENTMYAILLRPYRILTDGRKDAYPTYILATTLPEDTEIEITPVIPRLYEVGKTDISIEVEWEKTSNKVVYELAVDEIMKDDPSQASKIISSEDIKNGSIPYNKEDGREFLKYNIKPLFPDTGYYIWIRAIVEGTDKASDWSTPIYVKTNPISKPQPPSGFGLASEKSVATYNASNKKEYKPITDKYLILEWLRDPEDYLEDPKAENKDTAEPLLDPNIKKTYMVKFNELIANRYYYTRAKTKVYVSKGQEGEIEKLYSYIVEISINSDFKDSIQIEIPTIEPKGDRVLTAESDWTDTYKYRTSFSTDGTGDYDGNIIDDLYPLPTEDFEIVYDHITKTLTYRLRSNKTDLNGNADNLVDQRFITKLINNKVFDYNIDLTKHKGYEIKNRRVELPYSIISAFDQRKISFSITTGGTRFKLNPAFLNTSEVKKVGKLSTNAMVTIDIMQNPDNLPVLNHNQIYATTPEYIKIGLSNNGVYTPLTFTGSNMDIMLKLKNRSLTLDTSVGAYRNINNNVWERIVSSYSIQTGIHTVKTNRLGKYTTISNGVNQTNINANNDLSLMTSINSKIVFTDLNNLNMKSPISVVQFNNIVAGIASDKREISINGGLSDKDYQSLQRSGMLLQGSVVGREAGINSLVKLYEMKTKAKYEAISNINTTPYKDIKNANKVYQANLIKAGDIGFYKDSKNANPKNVMTIEEMFYMVDIILADSGY
ncbi:hypothetical protein [uncultured Tyzzerella sp.]|uniref:hypothetical protein n=1 Tax=uncultured Tyzzerella sp. TaxID=2321398 RepID=UPI002942A425|nr:hypothetical protein [uncultured Tyzzerella sp.]